MSTTQVDKIFFVRNVKEIQHIINEARKNGKHVTISK
jgi:hypothetical protein